MAPFSANIASTAAMRNLAIRGMDIVRRIQKQPDTDQYLDRTVPITSIRRRPAESLGGARLGSGFSDSHF